jgi:hypothetical protein
MTLIRPRSQPSKEALKQPRKSRKKIIANSSKSSSKIVKLGSSLVYYCFLKIKQTTQCFVYVTRVPMHDARTGR